ncbi:MAG: hypothetical protein A3D90_09385 [Sulfuricurvum sp. RIFCSPHIGHO2_02_FULL_43_9]|nr:MAG: hypothetical protein A3D90_09385 [Sulfuricurvum sp. RIFCSPHIGHO2_02_FULL_43_9]
MVERIKKIVETGYGLGLLSLVEARKIASKVKKELRLSDDESLKLARELVANSKQARKEVLGTANRYFESAMEKSGVASKGELRAARTFLKRRARRVKDKMKQNLAHMKKR